MLTSIVVGFLVAVVVYLITYNVPGFGELGSAATALLLAIMVGTGLAWYPGFGNVSGKGIWKIEHVKAENQLAAELGEATLVGGLIKIDDEHIYFKGKNPETGESLKVKEKIIYEGKEEKGHHYETTEAEYRFVTKGDMKKLIKKEGVQLILSKADKGINSEDYLAASERKQQKYGKSTAQADARNILVNLIANM